MMHPGRLVALALLGLLPALLAGAVLASGDDGAPPERAVARSSEATGNLRSLLPTFLRNLLGMESVEPVPATEGSAAATGAPERRPSLLSLVEPLWIDLTPAQQKALAPFAPEWNTWSAAEKKSWVSLADRLGKMTAERRKMAENRIVEWANLTPAQRQMARENYRLAKERSAQERVLEWRNYQSLTEEQQNILRRAGRTSNTAAGHAGSPSGLAREASQPLPRVERPVDSYQIYPARGAPLRP